MTGIEAFLASHLKAAGIADNIGILITINTFFFALGLYYTRL
jgi:hypothetical protein